MKFGKKYANVAKKVDRNKRYSFADACKLVRETKTAKFNESVDVAINLGVDTRNSDQQVRAAINLPHGTGRTVRVAVFAKGPKAEEAKAAGADVVGSDDLAAQVEGGFLGFDKVVATPDMMGVVGKLGKVLGPRGLMPNPRLGTVTMDVAKTVSELKSGRIEFKADKTGIVHSTIGRVSFTAEQLLENLNAILAAVMRAKPQTMKGQYLRKMTLSSTMGPGIRLDSSAFGGGAAE